MPDQEKPPQAPPPPAPPSGGDNLVPINIEDEMKRSYLDYAMSVIVGRALPDIRDGLKPVHRRILFGMQEMGLRPTGPRASAPRSSATSWASITRTATSPIYDALVRMAQPFLHALSAGGRAGQLRLGRWRPARGHAVHRSPAVAHRHRAARRHRQGNRRFPPQLRRERSRARSPAHARSEPAGQRLRPASPSAWPPTFRRTTCTEIIERHHPADPHPQTPLAKILEIVQGPDFPTGGFILGRAGHCRRLHQGPRPAQDSRQGRHRDASARTASRSSSPKFPTRSTSRGCIEQIAALVNEKSIEGISEIRDESDRDGMRIVLRAEARRAGRGRAQQPLQAHAAADRLRHHHALHRQRPAARAGPDRDASSTSSTTASTWCAAAPSTNCARPASASTSCSASRRRSTIWTK